MTYLMIFSIFVPRGEKYLSCNYLEIISEEKKFICYKKCTSQVVVLPGEVLSPFVNISEDLKLSLEEKQWLSDCA